MGIRYLRLHSSTRAYVWRGLWRAILSSGVAQVFTILGNCGIPTTANAVRNVTVVVATGSDYLTLYPEDQVPPTTSKINFFLST